MENIAILSYQNAALFELGCAVELFGLDRPEIETWYQCEVVSFESGPLTMTAGIELKAKVVKHLDDYSMLVIPSWPTDGRAIPRRLSQEIIRFHSQGKRLISFCSGAFLLASLGILDDRDASTHWQYAERFKRLFPKVSYVDDVLYVFDGKIGSSAGSAAAIDLGIEIIRRDMGYRIANKVARRLVMSAHRQGGQSQFAEMPLLENPNQFTLALDWALNNLSRPIDIDTLATRADMSRRSFDRKFKSSLNLSAKTWLTQQRIRLAKELLESTSDKIEKIADLSGFETAITLRHHFKKLNGVSPTQYRNQFSSRL